MQTSRASPRDGQTLLIAAPTAPSVSREPCVRSPSPRALAPRSLPPPFPAVTPHVSGTEQPPQLLGKGDRSNALAPGPSQRLQPPRELAAAGRGAPALWHRQQRARPSLLAAAPGVARWERQAGSKALSRFGAQHWLPAPQAGQMPDPLRRWAPSPRQPQGISICSFLRPGLELLLGVNAEPAVAHG